MTNSSDVAEQLVKTYMEIYLEGTKIALNISGKAAKNIASALYVVAKDSNKTKGKTRLTNMLKGGKELKIFPVRREDLKKFTTEAKRYGVLYCALMHKDDPDGMVDIMVKAEDASKIDRIVKRFNIQTMSEAEVTAQVIQARESISKNEKNKGVQVKDKEIMQKDINQKGSIQTEKDNVSPSVAKTEKKPLLENSLESKKKLEGTVSRNKPSVKKELKKIKEDLENKEKLESKEKTKENVSSNKKLNKKKTKKKARTK